LAAPLFTGRIFLPVSKGAICLNRDLTSVLLPGLGSTFKTSPTRVCPHRFSLEKLSPSIEMRKPDMLKPRFASWLLPNLAFNNQNLIDLSLSAPLAAPLHWKNFSSSIEKRNPDLLKPSFSFWTLLAQRSTFKT
jgi:hypothetical protein